MTQKNKEGVARVAKGMCGSFVVKEKNENSCDNYICIQGFVVLGDTNAYVTHVKFKVYNCKRNETNPSIILQSNLASLGQFW